MGRRKKIPAPPTTPPPDHPDPATKALAKAEPRPDADTAMAALREVHNRTGYKADTSLPDEVIVDCALPLSTIRKINRIIRGE